MLSIPLPPVRRSQSDGTGEMLEAFALCYLASYNGTSAGTRSHTAYANAWGYSAIQYFPRIDGACPAFVVATYGSGPGRKVIVAIEGMTSFSQLISWCNATDSMVNNGASPGRILSIFSTYATAVQSRMNAAGYTFTGSFANPDVTVAGFSLGAAVAELFCNVQKIAHVAYPIQCIKFASPRIGDRLYNSNGIPNYPRQSIYVKGDPIAGFPRVLTNRIPGQSFTNLQPVTWYRQDGIGRQLQILSDEWTGLPEQEPLEYNRALVRLTQSLTNPDNPWFFHLMTTYRQAFLNLAYLQGANLNYYRFRYLEHPDENSYQTSFVPGVMAQSSTWTVLDPAPDLVDVPIALLSRVVAPSTTPTTGGSVYSDWPRQDTDSIGSGGDDWGYTGPAGTTHRGGRRNP